MQFTYQNSTTLFFGQQKIATLAMAIPTDKKVLVIYGGGSIKTNGVYDQVSQALQQHHWQSMGGIQPNPSIEQLSPIIHTVKKDGIDFILAVGGGSVIDGCKFIAAAAMLDDDNYWSIMTGHTKIRRALPLGCVLTLPATGSESNSTFVISKQSSGDKLAMMSRFTQPQFAVLDPDVIKTLPEHQIANGLVDAFVHCCEQYLTYPTSALVQEHYAEALMQSLVTLANRFDERDSDNWRANLMLCCNQALNGFIGSGVPQDWATHMIGHELTACYGLDHARSLAIIHCHLLRHKIDAKRDKLVQLGQRVFDLNSVNTNAEQTIEAIETLYKNLGMAVQLKQSIESPQADISDAILQKLNEKGEIKLGEKRDISHDDVKTILANAY